LPRSVAIVVKGYPRLSETFIAQEIRELERRGLDILIVSLRHPTDPEQHPIHAEIGAPVHYLPEYLYDEPERVTDAWAAMRDTPTFEAAHAAWLADFRRDSTANRVRRFGQAVVLAHELPDHVEHLYAHFLHTPASVTRYCAMLRALPWSCSAHAKDIWTSPDWEKSEKLADADWTVTCTQANAEHLSTLAPPGKVSLVYHGLDFERFPVPPTSRLSRDGQDQSAPVRLLSVGRLVEKKGYDVLLEALARLPAEINWHLDHVGGGTLGAELRAQADRLGLGARIDWHGPLAQRAVIERYRAADLFVLASRVAADGDRDGLPNVLMEAQTQALACLSTEVPGIRELIDHGSNGWLVPPDHAEAMAAALAKLIADPDLRAQLGITGHDQLRRRFDMSAGIDHLTALFGISEPAAAVGD
jgi:glycosyltransferase involved in cell wall biosynthesis